MRRLPRVPDVLVGGLGALPELFWASAKWRGMRREDVDEIVRLLPAPIRALTCFLDRLTGHWRYDYGEPFVGLPGGGIVFGTTMYHEVDRLFDVIDCARKRLPTEKLTTYLQRLADPNKHEDMLVEFAPILRLPPEIKADYEIVGYGEGNKTIDWLIPSEQVPLALDVKNRTRDLFESLVKFEAGERGPNDRVPDPTHDAEILFRSIESKFTPRAPSDLIQAAWVVTRLMQDEQEMSAAFTKLDASRVHAVILGDFADDVYVLTNEAAVKEHVLGLFQLRESRRFVFRRGEG
jgi:hypothetical protein